MSDLPASIRADVSLPGVQQTYPDFAHESLLSQKCRVALVAKVLSYSLRISELPGWSRKFSQTERPAPLNGPAGWCVSIILLCVEFTASIMVSRRAIRPLGSGLQCREPGSCSFRDGSTHAQRLSETVTTSQFEPAQMQSAPAATCSSSLAWRTSGLPKQSEPWVPGTPFGDVACHNGADSVLAEQQDARAAELQALCFFPKFSQSRRRLARGTRPGHVDPHDFTGLRLTLSEDSTVDVEAAESSVSWQQWSWSGLLFRFDVRAPGSNDLARFRFRKPRKSSSCPCSDYSHQHRICFRCSLHQQG